MATVFAGLLLRDTEASGKVALCNCHAITVEVLVNYATLQDRVVMLSRFNIFNVTY
jgi:hypothetical protein